jgi:hypothetical protein
MVAPPGSGETGRGAEGLRSGGAKTVRTFGGGENRGEKVEVRR